MECLTKGRVKGRNRCHLDPDLVGDASPRLPGWRPAFGQEFVFDAGGIPEAEVWLRRLFDT